MASKEELEEIQRKVSVWLASPEGDAAIAEALRSVRAVEDRLRGVRRLNYTRLHTSFTI